MFGSAVAGRICSIEGNNTCADCGCRSPRWASVNLGVLLCINCSGVHRKLGVHLSQVKSLTLDNLKPEWIKALTEIGNDVANKYYLHKLPAHAPRPNSNTSAKDMEIWIRNKYERKIYAMDGLDEPFQLLASGYSPREALRKGGIALAAAARSPQQPQAVTAPAVVHPSPPPFTATFPNAGNDAYGFDRPRAYVGCQTHSYTRSAPVGTGPSEDLFASCNAPANNITFDAFQDNAPQTGWSGDFWPMASGEGAGRGAPNYSPEMVPGASAGSSFDAGTSKEARIEAAKDSISKLFDNPAQIGFKNSSYPLTTPSCVKGDLLDFNFSGLNDKLQAQRKTNEDLI